IAPEPVRTAATAFARKIAKFAASAKKIVFAESALPDIRSFLLPPRCQGRKSNIRLLWRAPVHALTIGEHDANPQIHSSADSHHNRAEPRILAAWPRFRAQRRGAARGQARLRDPHERRGRNHVPERRERRRGLAGASARLARRQELSLRRGGRYRRDRSGAQRIRNRAAE